MTSPPAQCNDDDNPSNVLRHGMGYRIIPPKTATALSCPVTRLLPYHKTQGAEAVSEVQQVTVSSTASGTFTLSLNHGGVDYVTTALGFDATAMALQMRSTLMMTMTAFLMLMSRRTALIH